MKMVYDTFDTWKSEADQLGWVHCHDELVVCDDENDQCIGEFDSVSNEGWLIHE